MLIEILNVFAAVERKLKNVSYCQHFQVETMMESAFKSQHDLLLAMLCTVVFQNLSAKIPECDSTKIGVKFQTEPEWRRY